MNHRSLLTVRDMWLIPAHALQARQILVMTLFLVVGIGVYDLFVYVSHLVAGNDIGIAFRVYGFFPPPDMARLTIVGRLIAAVGMAASLYVMLIGMTAVAAFNAEQIRGNRFLRITEAIRFGFTRGRQLLVGQATIIGFILFVLAALALGGLLARVPFIGQSALTLFFVFPLYIIALFTVLIGLILGLSWFLMPAVAAWDRKGESLVVLLETFSTIIRRPFQWLGVTIYSVVAGKISSFVYAYFAYRAVQLLVWGMGLTDGGRMETLVRQAITHLPLRSDMVRDMCTIFPGFKYGFSLFIWARAGGDSLTSYAMAFMLYLIFASVVGYLLATLIAGQVYGYGLIRYLKDGYRVDQEKPLFTYDPLPEAVVPEESGSAG
jgi:hypothetical protein